MYLKNLYTEKSILCCLNRKDYWVMTKESLIGLIKHDDEGGGSPL